MEIYTKQNIINYTSDPDEANDFKYDRKLQEARKALREMIWKPSEQVVGLIGIIY